MNPKITDKWQDWLERKHRGKYVIHPDNTVDIKGNVTLSGWGLEELPFQFGDITGSFDCSCNHLTSLKYCPLKTMVISCYSNKLTSLRYCPEYVAVLDCADNKLTSLKYSPSIVGDFYCMNNNLTSLEYAPKVLDELHTSFIDKNLLDIEFGTLSYKNKWIENVPKLLYDNGLISQEEYFIHAL